MKTVEVTTYYLEMLDPSELRSGHAFPRPFAVCQAEISYPALNRFFYEQVGAAYHWTDRLDWSDGRWMRWIDRPEQQTWIGYVSGTPAGYFELEAQDGGNVELAYFGLLPPFVGQGLGGPFLSEAIRKAWSFDARRIWVHTCSLDHPAALGNYQARGFKCYDQKQTTQQISK